MEALIRKTRVGKVDVLCAVIPTLLLMATGILVMYFVSPIFGVLLLVPCLFILPAIAVVMHQVTEDSQRTFRRPHRRRDPSTESEAPPSCSTVGTGQIEPLGISPTSRVGVNTSNTYSSGARSTLSPTGHSPVRQHAGSSPRSALTSSARQAGGFCSQILVGSSPGRLCGRTRGTRSVTIVSSPSRQLHVLESSGARSSVVRESEPLDLPPSYEEAIRSSYFYYPPPAYEDYKQND